MATNSNKFFLVFELILAKAAPSSTIRLSDEKFFEQGLNDFDSCYFERSPQSVVMTDASSSSSPMSSSITFTAASISSVASSSSVDDHDQDFRRELEEFDHLLLNEFLTNSFVPKSKYEIAESSREKERGREKEQFANAGLSSSTENLEREFRKELEDFDHLRVVRRLVHGSVFALGIQQYGRDICRLQLSDEVGDRGRLTAAGRPQDARMARQHLL